LISDEFENVFKEVDLLVSPTSPITAFPMGAKLDDPLSMYLCDIATIPANLAGVPGISVNCGFDKNNLPFGLQFMSAQLKDKELMEAAFAFEKQIALSDKLPALVFFAYLVFCQLISSNV
jgi:aspartyl-tRNA(Asn)/glutamyl-tRNA(Gln) amidotransferase subunit A